MQTARVLLSAIVATSQAQGRRSQPPAIPTVVGRLPWALWGLRAIALHNIPSRIKSESRRCRFAQNPFPLVAVFTRNRYMSAVT